MSRSDLTRRGLLSASVAALGLAGLSACTSTAASASSPASSSTASGGAMSGGGAMGGAAMQADAVVTALHSEVASKFAQKSYEDASTGSSLPYNVFLPDGYDASKSYPLVLYIADSSLVGQATTAPLSQYGALIWASAAEQQVREAIVVVPEYPEVILDDHSGHTTTAWVELTARFVDALKSTYAVDPRRVYGTGQSMGCMTVMLLAAEHPDLFTAELLVSGQWEKSALAGLAKQKFCYIAAGGDANSTGGQKDVESILKSAGVPYGTTTLDATWSSAKQNAAVTTLLVDGDRCNFATFKTGTVLTAAGQTSSSGGMGGSGEHMASFEPAYKITALRKWLFAQIA